MADKIWSAGQVGIDIKPITDGFYAKLDALLARAADKSIDVAANLDFDDGAARRQLDKWRSASAEVKVKANDSQVRQLVDKWDGKSVNAKLDLDTKKFKRDLKSVESELKKVGNQADWQKYWLKNERELKKVEAQVTMMV